MSRYDGLIIPRSYSEYLNKTDSATLSQMLQHLTGLWSHAVSAGDQKPVTSDAVNAALKNYCIFDSRHGLKCNYTKLNGLVNAHFTYRSSTKVSPWTSFIHLPVPLSGSNIKFKIGDADNNYDMVILASTGLIQNGAGLPAGEYYGSVSYEHA